jgi:hypothetical protein
VAKPREDQSRPSEEDRWQRSRDLVSSEVREVEVQKLDAPSREWRSHERIRSRPSEEDRWQRSRDLANSGVHRVNAQVVGVKSREARGHEATKWRED